MNGKSQPPIPIEDVRSRILATIADMRWDEVKELLIGLAEGTPDYWRQHIELEHTIPGPSSATSCIRQQWCKVQGKEPDRKLPESWTLRAANGTVLEPFWYVVLDHAGFGVDHVDRPIDVTPTIMGTPDGRFRDFPALLELKSLTAWSFTFVWEHGVEKERDDHWAQAQLYMAADNKPWCLYLAAAADPSAASWMLRRMKKRELARRGYDANDPATTPWFHVEWIPYKRAQAVRLIKNLGTQQTILPKAAVPGRLYDPETTAWPCQLGCRWIETCRKYGE